MQNISAEKLQRNLRELSIYLDLDVKKLAEMVRGYHPLELLKMACWEYRRIDQTSKPDDAFSRLVALRTVEYLQAVVTAAPAGSNSSSNRNIKSKDWKRLGQLMEDFCKRTIRYIDNYTLLCSRQGMFGDESDPQSLVDMVRFQQRCFNWCFPSAIGQGEIADRISVLHQRLLPFSEAIGQTFECGLDALLAAFTLIAHNAQEGIDKLREDCSVFKDSSMVQIERLRAELGAGPSMQELMERVIREQGWEGLVSNLVDRRDDFGLYDILKLTSLPPSVCDRLAVSVGDGTASYESSAHAGWLLYELPSRKKPFFKFNGTYYCFTGLLLLSDAYEAIKSAVLQAFPGYASEWEAIEKSQRTTAPISILERLLPSLSTSRDIPCERPDGSFVLISAVFQDARSVVLTQVSPVACTASPFDVPSDVIQSMRDESIAIDSAKGGLASLEDDRTKSILYIDASSDAIRLPDAPPVDGFLSLSFGALISLASRWDGAPLLRTLLSLPPAASESSDLSEMDSEDEISEEQPEVLVADMKEQLDTPIEDSLVSTDSPLESFESEPIPSPDDDSSDDCTPEQASEVEVALESDLSSEPELVDDDYVASELEDFDYDDSPYATVSSAVLDPVRATLDPPEARSDVVVVDSQPELFTFASDDFSVPVPSVLDEHEPSLIPEDSQPPQPEEIADHVLVAPEIASDSIAKAVMDPMVETEPMVEAEPVVVMEPESIAVPDEPNSMDMPSCPVVVEEVLAKLGTRAGSEFRRICQSSGDDFLNGVVKLINQAKAAQLNDGKDKMFTLPGTELTIVLCVPQVDKLREMERRNNVAAIMYTQEKTQWHALYITYNTAGILADAKEMMMRQSDFSTSDWKLIMAMGEKILARRREHGTT